MPDDEYFFTKELDLRLPISVVGLDHILLSFASLCRSAPQLLQIDLRRAAATRGKMACGRKVAPGTTKSGNPYDTCCRAWAEDDGRR